MQLLKRVELIDDVRVNCSANKILTCKIDMDLVPLAHLRDASYVDAANEQFVIMWEKDGIRMSEFDGQTSIELDHVDAVGMWNVTVQFKTDEVRVDTRNRLKGHAGFMIREDGYAI